jgi:type IV pilus assembly protein PilA
VLCAGCGNRIAEGERFCRVCGKEAAAPSAAASGAGIAAPAVVPQTSGKAIVSFTCGLFFFVLPISIVAIVFGHLSLSEIRRSAGRLKGDGLAIAGLVLGYLGVVAIPFILIIAAIAIPNLLRARMAANESSAVASMRTLMTAEYVFSQTHPKTGFTCSLSDLAGADLIDHHLASGQNRGYALELAGCTSTTEQANVKFQVLAYPVTLNTTGTRAFCSDESGVIKVAVSGSPQDCLTNGSTLE